MGLSVTFVSGLRRSGKSAVIRTMIDLLWRPKPHYIRLVKSGGDKLPPKPLAKPPRDCGVASARWLEYDDEHVFEILPGALAAIHRQDHNGAVVIEADADPTLRCAFPYDYRVFVMPVPSRVSEVFRDPSHAAEELQRVLDDTAAFASEIFGLFAHDGQEDSDPSEERTALTDTQARGFLYSPLGDELATRIQLQPPYHGLVESDVIVVNTAVGKRGAGTDGCLIRVERLLHRIRGASGQRSEMFHCDPRNYNGRDCKRLLKALKPMCRSRK
jgi:hypothetical protein